MTGSHLPTRRAFLNQSLSAGAALAALATSSPALAGSVLDPRNPLPLIDLHAHLDHSTIDQVVALGKQRNVHFGIVEHAGTKQNKYPVVLSNDDELKAYIKMLEGKGVYKGIQAEWKDWMSCFSPEVLGKLDYVLTDAMTFPGKQGERIKLWEPAAAEVVGVGNHEDFMDRFVDWHVEIMDTEPFDILANASWLPDAMMPEYDSLWTEGRIGRVIDAAVQHTIAIEISASYKLPRMSFLRQAKAAGLKFSFGSNGRYPKMGLLEYSLAMAESLNLTDSDLFKPGVEGRKAVQRRRR
jgi:histidinol phosphatase-like PHP family hydrolase